MLATPVEEEGEEENKNNSGKEQSFPDESQATECCSWNDNKERMTNSTSQLHQFHGILPKDLGQKIHGGFFHYVGIYSLTVSADALAQHFANTKRRVDVKISGNSL